LVQANQDRTLLYVADDGFTVETPRATTKIKSVGRWTLPIAVHAMPLKRLLANYRPARRSRFYIF
jgi:hypothetical protein